MSAFVSLFCSNTLSLSLPFSQAALTVLDQKVLAKMKRLNALKHTTQTHQRRLEDLKMEYQRMKPEGSSGAQSADARTRKKEEDAMVVTSEAHVEMWKTWKTLFFFSLSMKYTRIVHKYMLYKQCCVLCLQNRRALENSLEKTQFKCKEAENIMANYLKLKSHLQVIQA